MFAHHTVMAIVALAACDAGVTQKERDTLSTFLSGRARDKYSPSAMGEPFFTYAKAARELGVSVPTVKRRVKNGSLTKIAGLGKRAIGVTASSVRRLKQEYDGT